MDEKLIAPITKNKLKYVARCMAIIKCPHLYGMGVEFFILGFNW
jgi:hypothetical protein